MESAALSPVAQAAMRASSELSGGGDSPPRAMRSTLVFTGTPSEDPGPRPASRKDRPAEQGARRRPRKLGGNRGGGAKPGRRARRSPTGRDPPEATTRAGAR